MLCRTQPCSLSGILQPYQQLLISLSLSLPVKVLPHALLPLAKGPPPLYPERLAWLRSGTAVQSWLKLLSHHTRVVSQQCITTRSWFEEGALVQIFRSVVYMPDNHALLLLCRSVGTHIPVKQGQGVLHQLSQIISFPLPAQLGQGVPILPTPHTARVVGSSPESLKAGARLQPTYQPYLKRRAEQSKHPGRIPRHMGCPQRTLIY